MSACVFRRLGPLGAMACLAAACGSSPAPASSPEAGACTPSDALWASSDYSSSAVGSLQLSGPITATTGRVDLGADPALSVSHGDAFFVARDLDTLFALDPVCGTPTRSYNVHVASQSGSSDPQDVAVASDGSLWVPLYGVPSVLVLSPAGEVTSTIDLSSYDADGNPDASSIAIVDTPAGEKAFVALERLDNSNGNVYLCDQPSWMLRIDVATAAVEATIVLAGRNPFAMENDGGILWLAEPCNFDDATETNAGIERFDTSTSTSTLVATEPELGGSVAEVTVSSGCGVAIVANAVTNVNATSLVTFDPAGGAVLADASSSPLTTDGFDLEGLAWIGGAVAVGDRNRASDGYPVHVLDATAACILTERDDTVFLPLPPVGVRTVN
jgi:hypothetical protein